MTKRMAVKIEDINSFTLSGTIVEGTGGELKVRCNACEWTVYVKNPAKRDFTGCRGIFWGKLSDGKLMAKHYHVFLPTGERIHVS